MSYRIQIVILRSCSAGQRNYCADCNCNRRAGKKYRINIDLSDKIRYNLYIQDIIAYDFIRKSGKVYWIFV